MKIKTKKRIKYFVAFLILTTMIFAFLANRDIKRIYGGLTEQVDSTQFEVQTSPVAINNVNVLAPDGESFISGQTVYIDNGFIVSIDNLAKNSKTIQTINGEGKYLIPGLTDAHVHLWQSPNDLLLYIANGVTQIRELAGTNNHIDLKQQVNQGRLGPDMFVASTRIGSFEFFEGLFMGWAQGFLNINNASEAEKEVKKLHKQGYDAVKIYSHINKESYLAVSETAKSLDMQVVGHVPFVLGMSNIYPIHDEISHLEEIMNAMNREFGEYGPDSSEEFLAYVEARSDEIASELYKNDIVVTTTLWLVESFIRQKTELETVLREVEFEYENPGISEWSKMAGRGLGWLPAVNRYKWPEEWSEERRARSKIYWKAYAKACQLVLKSLMKHNVKIMTGTDANITPAVPGFSLHDEFVSLNNVGMTASQILRSATAIPAEHLKNNAGIIMPGRKAHLVLLDKNPLIDIRNTKAINSVILNGRVLNRDLLDQLLASVKQANDSSRTQEISQYLD